MYLEIELRSETKCHLWLPARWGRSRNDAAALYFDLLQKSSNRIPSRRKCLAFVGTSNEGKNALRDHQKGSSKIAGKKKITSREMASFRTLMPALEAPSGLWLAIRWLA